jgi:hypothetical protein
VWAYLYGETMKDMFRKVKYFACTSCVYQLKNMKISIVPIEIKPLAAKAYSTCVVCGKRQNLSSMVQIIEEPDKLKRLAILDQYTCNSCAERNGLIIDHVSKVPYREDPNCDNEELLCRCVAIKAM